MAESGKALGFIETRGFIAVVEAADSMLKAASVSLSTSPGGFILKNLNCRPLVQRNL